MTSALTNYERVTALLIDGMDDRTWVPVPARMIADLMLDLGVNAFWDNETGIDYIKNVSLHAPRKITRLEGTVKAKTSTIPAQIVIEGTGSVCGYEPDAVVKVSIRKAEF